MKVAALVLVCGCGRILFDPLAARDAASDAPSSTSGTRLRAEHWVTDDGVATFADWYDTQLDLRCRFSTDATGTLRCFPVDAFVDVFSDPACLTPAISVPTGCTSPRTVAADSTGSNVTAYELGAPLASPYTYDATTTCIPATGGASYYARGAPVPSAMFVSATYMPGASGGGITAMDVVADDGARAFDHLNADMTGTRCDVSAGSCWPQTTYATESTRLYSDPACSSEVARATGPGPYLTLTNVMGACAGSRLVATSGTPMVQLQSYYRDTVAGCIGNGVAITAIAITDVSVPRLTRAVGPGTTRLRTTAWVTATGDQFQGPLFDTQLGAPCKPVTDTSDHTSCVPASYATTLGGYTSPDCTGPLLSVDVECDGGDSVLTSPTIPTCEGLGYAVLTYMTPTAIQTVGYAAGCIAIDATDARMFPKAQAMLYDPARTVPMHLVRD